MQYLAFHYWQIMGPPATLAAGACLWIFFHYTRAPYEGAHTYPDPKARERAVLPATVALAPRRPTRGAPPWPDATRPAGLSLRQIWDAGDGPTLAATPEPRRGRAARRSAALQAHTAGWDDETRAEWVIPLLADLWSSSFEPDAADLDPGARLAAPGSRLADTGDITLAGIAAGLRAFRLEWGLTA